MLHTECIIVCYAASVCILTLSLSFTNFQRIVDAFRIAFSMTCYLLDVCLVSAFIATLVTSADALHSARSTWQ